jgi:predicted metal-dependent peptidase
MKKFFSSEDYKEVLINLLEHHSIFYKFWNTCRPIFSKSVETAAVTFDKSSRCISFLINPDFWDSQSLENKKFIICHECFHILNFHANRVQNKFSYNANCAMDIVVNESLVKYFKFLRNEIDPRDEYCWLNTCFKPEENAQPWSNFEYYLNLLNKSNPSQNFKLINNHENLGSIPSEALSDFLNQLSEEEIDVIKNIASDSEKNNNNSRGDGAGALIKNILESRFQKKKKWESIIKKFEKKIKKQQALTSHWLNKPRRLSSFQTGLFIPTEVEHQIKRIKSEKIDTWFFLDTSGSCWNLADRFFKAAKSLDPEIFDVRYFFFDTQIYPTTLKNPQVMGGGGTTFSCISQYIQKQNKNPYVWVLTDGFGDMPNIDQTQQKKWSWFLTENGCTDYIPSKCKIYSLQDFE